ncbi:MAG: acetyl-CoA carboxylase carboxyl transferase subunit beta, partial [Spirochaetes bacterium]|nr:acetyl-CoA carboxylase carboxyl transferase subunit beta [Spirochaetota bacterium]
MSKKWYERDDKGRIPVKVKSKKVVPGMWNKCPQCGAMVYKDDLENNFFICPSCDHHFLLDAFTRIGLITDSKSFKEIDKDVMASDPLSFSDSIVTYRERVKQTVKKSKLNEAVITGTARINSMKVSIAVLDFKFFGG